MIADRGGCRLVPEPATKLVLKPDLGFLDNARKLAAFRFDKGLELRRGGLAPDDALAVERRRGLGLGQSPRGRSPWQAGIPSGTMPTISPNDVTGSAPFRVVGGWHR